MKIKFWILSFLTFASIATASVPARSDVHSNQSKNSQSRLQRVIAQACIPGLGCLGGSGGADVTLGSFNVYFKNRTSSPIKACASWYQNQTFSKLGGGSTNWDSGCWNLAPGEKAFVINNATGRNIYISATATDGSGRTWPEKQVDMGSRYTRFEYTFNP
jgi:hypothetical protein